MQGSPALGRQFGKWRPNAAGSHGYDQFNSSQLWRENDFLLEEFLELGENPRMVDIYSLKKRRDSGRRFGSCVQSTYYSSSPRKNALGNDRYSS
jgi:hypothetical protein